MNRLIELPEELHERIEELADRRGESIAEVLREILEAELIIVKGDTGQVTIPSQQVKTIEPLDQFENRDFVMLSDERYQALLEELEELQDALAALEVEARIAAGEEEVYSWEEVKADLDALQD